jgi:hypothetical protein
VSIPAQHAITISYVPPSRQGVLVLMGGHRARCSCGWGSDCYSQLGDTHRAVEVHQRRAKREELDKLIERSSIGVAIADVKERGIDAHLADLERETRRPRKSKVAIAKKATAKKAGVP